LEFLIAALLIIVFGVVFILIQRVIYKRSIAFKIAAITTIPVVLTGIAGYFLGQFGKGHAWWVFLLLLPSFIYTSHWKVALVRKPLKKMVAVIKSLARGDVRVDITDKALYDSDEFTEGAESMKSLVNALQGMIDYATLIGHGDLDAFYQTLSENDALGNALVEMQNNLKSTKTEQDKLKIEEEQRNWITVGLAKFSEILRQDNDNIEVLSYNIVVNLVEYLGASLGGVFLLNEDSILEMKACYAYDRQKFIKKQIQPGEGLIGSCYLESKPIYMTDVPGEYITVKSGLGGASPKTIFIAPLKLNDEKFGVIELASFHALEPYQREFVLKVSESIAATISSVNVNLRTNQLLQQTKIQAEEMANAEEELRQNMEEMQATHEEMRRRESDLQETLSKMTAIQASEEEFEEKLHWYEAMLDAFTETPISVTDMSNSITFLNQAALNLLGITRNEAIGKYCGNIWRVDICRDERCSIECLKRNRGKSIFNFGDTTFTSIASYIKDRSGANIGHIEVLSNITDTVNHEFEMEQLNEIMFDSFNIVEFSPEGVITDINNLALNLFESASRNDFVGKHLKNFIGETETEMAWKYLSKGNTYENRQKISTGVGKSVIFRQKFVPICDKKGKMLRGLILSYNE
jgi:PAS domain-containing protein